MSNHFDLDKAVAAWRRSLTFNRAFDAADLDELERHVRDQVEALARRGVPHEAAFHRALEEMGSYGEVENEYRKVYWGKRRRRRQLLPEFTWRLSMLTNYFKIALRNFKRQKGYAFINIAGLMLGMACCLLLFQYVAHEYSFDQFNTKKDRIYRSAFKTTQNGEDQGFQALTGFIFGPVVADELPEVVRFARVHPNYGDAVVRYDGPTGQLLFKEERLFYADSTFLTMFTYPLAQGDRDRALTAPQTLLLSESMAQKYFGNDSPIGKTMDISGLVQGPYTVTGVFQDMLATSHVQIDFLLPLDDLLKSPQYTAEGAGWGWTNFITYLETGSGTDPHVLEKKITDLYYRYQGDQLASANTVAQAHLQPLLDIHLNADIQAPATVMGNRKTVYFFLLIGLFTLVIALVNYVNLATARALDRAREVGVRKAVGAHQRQLMSQFLIESALMNLVALMLAIGLSVALLPMANRLAGVELTGVLWLDARFWAAFLGVFGLAALLSGLYPAFVLSSFKPVTVLKGKVGAFTSRVALRKGLVVVQFAASIVLIAGTVIVYNQLHYVRSMDIGLDLDQILVVEGPRTRSQEEAITAMNSFNNEMRKIPAVEDMAYSVRVPGRGFNWYAQFYRASADPGTGKDIRATGIDEDFIGLYGLTLVAGEPLREGMSGGEDDTPVLVNETLVKKLGFASDEAAIGHTITGSEDGPLFTIKGVLKDFNWSSAHQATEAVMFYYVPDGQLVSLKVSTEDLPGTLVTIQQAYEALFPDTPFVYSFADETFDAQYKNEQRFATLFGVFAGIAILIACLGLFGLVAFTAESRTKEIGVRKALGATVPSIIALLSKDFVRLVGIAFIVAVPLAYYVMDQWLDGFAYRIEMGLGVFLLTGGLALAIALLTVSYQAIKAALADPVKSLRYE